MSEPPQEPLRILAVSEVWQGSNAYAFVRAFRRAGHSVQVLADETFQPTGWKNPLLRALRRAAAPLIVKDFTAAVKNACETFRPHLLFVFKGVMVTAEAIKLAQRHGAVAINFWPDVSFQVHGGLIPQALPCYDWIFTTKTFGIADIASQLGVTAASYLPHGFDPETHRPLQLSEDDRKTYECDASFIGAWSPHKERLIAALLRIHPRINLKIWGVYWTKSTDPMVLPAIIDRPVLGDEYAKAIVASKINLAILSEVRRGASEGDNTTSRTFHIPGAGGFMLHQRTDEVAQFFEDGKECAMFSSAEEMADKVHYYLDHEDERLHIAAAGRARSIASGYAIDDRAKVVVERARRLLAKRHVRDIAQSATVGDPHPPQDANCESKH